MFVQPSQYINTLLVPKDGEIPVDDQCLAAQGIFDVVCACYCFFWVVYHTKSSRKMCLYETTIYDVPHFISKLSSIHLKIKLRQYAF